MHVVLCRIVYVTNTFEFDLISYVWVSVQFMFSVTQSDISVAKFHARFKIKTCGGKHFWHNMMCSVETSAFHSFWNTSCSFVDSGKPDAVWPVFSWLGCRPIVHSPQCAVTADKWSMEINWFHSQSRCLAFYNLWVSHRRCFLKQSPQRPSWILMHIWTLYQKSCFPQIYRNVVLLKTYAGKAYLLFPILVK